MTPLGEILAKRSVNKAEVARRAGLTKARMNELTMRSTTRLTAEELYLIALAINVDPRDFLQELMGHLELRPINATQS